MNLKKIVSGMVALTLVMSLSACGKEKKEKSSKEEKVTQVTTVAQDSIDDTSTVADSIDSDSTSESEESSSSAQAQVQIPELKISSDWTDCEFAFDGQVIRLGESKYITVSNKWANYCGMTEDFDDILGDSEFTKILHSNEEYITADNGLPIFAGVKAYFDISGKGDDNCSWNEATIIRATIDARNAFYYNNASRPEIMFPKHITFGIDKESIISAYGEPDDVSEEFLESDLNGVYSYIYDNCVDSEEIVNIEKNLDKSSFESETLTYYSGDKSISFTVTKGYGLISVTLMSEPEIVYY